jgi:Tfp pilus assembly protein PilZ
VQKLVARFSSRGDLIAAYATQGSLGGIFVPGLYDLRVGEMVLLELTLEANEELLSTPAIVRWLRIKPTRKLPAGVGVEFAPHLKNGIPDLYGPDGNITDLRRAPRYDVKLGADYQLMGFTIHRTVANLSHRGALIETDIPPNPGLIFPVVVTGADGAVHEVTVTSVRKLTETPAEAAAAEAAAKIKGVGVQFITTKPDDQYQISRIMANIAIGHLDAK